jgi:hypothetical protein
MLDKFLLALFICGFTLFFLFLFGVIIHTFIFRIRLYFQFPALAKENGFDYINSWKTLRSREEPFPSYLTSNWSGFTTFINRIVKGVRRQRPFYFMRYQRYSFWKRDTTTLDLFLFKNPKNLRTSFLIMPSRLFANFQVKVPNLNGDILNKELKETLSGGEIQSRFLSKYQIKMIGDGSKEEISKHLTPSLMECLLEKPYWYIYSDGDWLLVYLYPGLIFSLDLRKQLEQTTKIATLLGF